MPKFAQIIDDTVAAVMVASAAGSVDWQAVGGDVQIGWIADGQGGYTAPPEPDPDPVALDALAFQIHVQTVAGMTDADVLAALDDVSLRLMWKRLEMATSVPKDAALTASGLDALVTTGHITDADKAAILEQWPTA